MNTPYLELKYFLADKNIFFRARGGHRHSNDDKLFFDENCVIEPYSAFLHGSNLYSMGSFSYSWSNLPTDTVVGRFCSIAKSVSVISTRETSEWITTSSSTFDSYFIIFKKYLEDNKKTTQHFSLPAAERNHGLIIGNDVSIGVNVVFKQGIIIGDGAIISANSVVMNDVPPFSIIAGNPAKIVKYRFNDSQITKLKEIKWWRYSFADIQQLDIKNIDRFIKEFEDHSLTLEEFNPLKISLPLL